MKLITLHDHLNPSTEVPVDAESITSVTPFGSGSSVCDGTRLIGVHETPAEVRAIARAAVTE